MSTGPTKHKIELLDFPATIEPSLGQNFGHRSERPQYLTVEEVAELIKVSPAWVRAHANGNRYPIMPSIKLGKYRRFRRQAVLDFIQALEHKIHA